MEETPIDNVTIISPKPAPNDSFVGPEFVNAHAAIKRSDRICRCTSCGREKDCTIDKLYAHPVLKVLVCDACEKFYHFGEFTKDSEGYDEQCRWCGQGGNLLMCDSPDCTYSFCNYCIKRNFSSETFAEILAKDTWKCFCCDKSQLRRLMEECRKFVNFYSVRPKHQKGLKAINVSVPESLTKANEQIDSIIDPLERSCNGLDDEVFRFRIKEHQVYANHINKKVTPLTIFRKQDHYVVQRKSVSCDEADPISHDSRTQSDPEFPMKLSKKDRLESKIGKIKIKIENPLSNESYSGEMTSKDVNEDVPNGDNNMKSTTNTYVNGNVETGSDKVENMGGKTDTARRLDMSDVDDNQSNTTVTKPQPVRKNIESKTKEDDESNATITKPQPVRKNVGRRTKANRVGTGSDNGNCNGQTKKGGSCDHDSDELTDHKSVYSNPKLEKAGKLFDQYINLISDLLLEDCSLSTSSSTAVHQSPSQYSRFRAANAVLQNVKNASKQLSVMELTLRKTKTKLATYRNIVQSPKSTAKEDGSNRLNWDSKVKTLMEKFNELSNPTTNSLSGSSETDEPSIADDVKLLVDPQVTVKKLNEEQFKKLIEPYGDPQSDYDVSSLMLDSDSSKHHHGSESEDTQISTDGTSKSIDIENVSDLGLSDDSESEDTERSTDETPKRKKNDDDPNSSKKHVNKKKSKNTVKKDDVSDSSDFDSVMNNSHSLEISTDSDDDATNQQGQVHESDNNIAKNQLLQLLREDNAEEVDSDVEDLLYEHNNENKKSHKSNESTSKNTTSDGKAPIKHPLLSKHWDVSPSSKNSTTERPTAKRKKSQDNDENASKKKKELSANFNGNDNSDSDLSTDSDADIWVRKTRAGVKRARRSILDSDSDEPAGAEGEYSASDNSPSDDSDDFNFERSRKRRRTTRVLPSFDADHDESPRKQGRKNIRKVMDDNQTSHSTQEAKMEELERRNRVEAQKETVEADVIVIDDENKDDVENDAAVKKLKIRLLLSTKPVIEVHPELAQHLKPHQSEGVRFIWQNLIETVEFANTKRGTGCILSHCMGLGKTLQAIAFLHTVLLSEHLPKIKTALVICPFITVNNWMAEFTKWIPNNEIASGRRLFYCSLDPAKTEEDRMVRLNSWKTGGGVMIIGYSLFRSLLKGKKNDSTSWEMALFDPDILVCDEGHILKNAATVLAQFADRVQTKRRIILTGTPLQNNMIEYHCMVSLIKPRLLGDIKEFKNRFVNPIENGQHVDSTERDVRLMKKRAHVLHELLAGCVQRKDYTFLKEHLAPKYEYTLKVRLSQLQIRLYEKYLSLKPTGNLKSRKASLFRDFNKFLLIVCHPRCLVMQNEIHKKKTPECDDDNDEDEEEDGPSSDESVIILSDDDGESPALPVIPKPASLEDIHALSSGKLRLFIKSKSGKHPDTKSRKKLIGMATRYLDENFCKTKEFEELMKGKPVSELKALIKQHGGSFVGCSEKSDLVSLVKSLLLKEATSDEEWFEKLIPSQEKLYFANEHGGKVVLMLEILRGAAKLGDKVVIFSQSLITLDLIELVLRAESKDNCAKSVIPFSKWVRNKDYFRIDGSIPGNARTSRISNFNSLNNPRGRLLLVSTRAGSMGVNLIGANRAIVFDASWNPTHDIQSIFRIYRFGQTKTCYIYRLVAQGTMEEKIYERQVVKRSLSYRVVDEQQIPRHFTAADISELYTFKPDRTKRKDSVPECAPPRDALLASIINSTDLIVSFHEPDTLLDHQVSEELSEAERKAAWEEYNINIDNPTTKQVSLSFKAHLQTIPQHVLMSLCKHGGNILRLIDQKLLEISEKTLDKMNTEIRMKNRSITTEQVNLEVIKQKLNSHIQMRRLNSLKKIVSWHHDTAQKAHQSRFAAFQINGGVGSYPFGSSARGISGSTVLRNPVGAGPRHNRAPNPTPRHSQPRFTPRSRPFVNVPGSRYQQPPPPGRPNTFRFPSFRPARPSYRWSNAR